MALRRPHRVSHLWRCAHQQPPVAYFPPAKPLQRQGLPFISRVFGSVKPRRRVLRERQPHTPCNTAASGVTSFLLPPGGGSYKQVQGIILCSILAGLQDVSVPALFGNVECVALWGGSLSGLRMVPEGEVFFYRRRSVQYHFPE